MNDIDRKVDSVNARNTSPIVTSTKVEKKGLTKMDKIIVVGIILVGLLVVFADDIGNISDVDIFPEETAKLPADVHLYQFNDLASNDSVNVELWIKNIGEKIATDIELYVRARNQNGTILFSETISLTALVLRANETCSGIYAISFDNTTAITHTIELSWDEGRNSYTKTTTLP